MLADTDFTSDMGLFPCYHMMPESIYSENYLMMEATARVSHLRTLRLQAAGRIRHLA